MTTVAWTPGILAADSCVTVIDEDTDAAHRTYQRKLKATSFRESANTRSSYIAIASKGDFGIGSQLDFLISSQAVSAFVGRKRFCGYLDRTLNAKNLLKARSMVIGDGEYEAIMVLFRPEVSEIPFLVEPNGYVSRLDSAGHPYMAIGSDAAVALGAMHAGANAIDAVLASSKHGSWTGGTVNWIKYHAIDQWVEIACT